MELLTDGAYILSTTHTDYWVSMMLLVVITGIFAFAFSMVTIIIGAGHSKEWREFAIASLMLISVCTVFAIEASKHNGDVGGYTVFLTQDADVNELLSQYRVIAVVEENIWTVEKR